MRIKGLVMLAAALLAGCVTPPREDPHPRKLVDHEVGLSGTAAEPVAHAFSQRTVEA